MTVVTRLRIGTRASRLARAQAALFAEAVAAIGTGVEVELVTVRTRGDAISQRHPRGGFEATDGQFTAELEGAVAAGRVDLAVHSHKDLPTAAAEDLEVAAVLPRADARDCLVSAGGAGLHELRLGARVGSSSVRRARQLRAVRPDLEIRPIRGNVETRMARVDGGEYDAVVLACAGLDRLGIAVPDEARLPFEVMLPAPAQGALAVQVRRDRHDLIALLAALDHAATRTAVELERDLLVAIGGGCLAPLGAYAETADGRLRLRAVHLPDEGARPIRVDLEGSAGDAGALVAAAAGRLRAASEAAS